MRRIIFFPGPTNQKKGLRREQWHSDAKREIRIVLVNVQLLSDAYLYLYSCYRTTMPI